MQTRMTQLRNGFLRSVIGNDGFHGGLSLTPGRVALAGIAAGLLVTASGFAQHQLDRGDVLDANPGLGTGGRNLPIAQSDFRSRNLLVTGDVAGGRGFRGTVGYTAEFDFRDALGSDDLFDFRAGAAFSSPAAIRAGMGMERMRFGYDLGQFEYHRSAYAVSPDRLPDMRMPRDEFMEVTRRLDQLSMRTMSSELLGLSAEPTAMGMILTEDRRPVIIEASPLRGLTMSPWDRDPRSIGLTSYDAIRVLDEARHATDMLQIGHRFEPQFGEVFRSDIDELAQIEGRMDAGRIEDFDSGEAYRRILERVARRYADSEQLEQLDSVAADRFQERYTLLREMLAQDAQVSTVRTPEEITDDELEEFLRAHQQDDDPLRDRDPLGAVRDIPPRFDDPTRLDSPDDPAQMRDRDPDRDREPEPRTANGERLDVRTVAPWLRHGVQIDRFAERKETRFDELMTGAETALRRGEFFHAEQQFSRARRFIPDHPMAGIGLAHAQIGAGLHFAAGTTLRATFARFPEMIGTTFASELLPSEQRLKSVRGTLINRLERFGDRNDDALVLAYIGWQLDDKETIRKALSHFAEDDPMRDLLHAVWVEGEDPPAPADEAGQADDDGGEQRRHLRTPADDGPADK